LEGQIIVFISPRNRVGKPEGKRLLGRPIRIEMDLREIKSDGIDWIDLARDRGQ
jgi:hypothetical protein